MHFRQTYNQAPTKLCVLDIETLAPPSPSGGFPPWPVHRPLVASLLIAEQVPYGQWKFAIESVEFDDDQAAIARIDKLLAGKRAVTFNGKGFDLPVLSMAAMRASMFDCRNLTDVWASPRFGGSHIDIADVIAGYGSAPRVGLEMLCEAAGISAKTNGHGGDVSAMLREQGIESVKRYCEEDVASTLILFAMVQALRVNDPAYAASLIADFANWVHDAGLEHLEEFQKLSGNAVRERVRLLHRVEEGIRALDDRATTSFFEGASATPLKCRQRSAG